MKILFVIGDLESGGAEKVVSTLSNCFSYENEVRILMLSTSKFKPFYDISSRIKLIPLLKNNKKMSPFKKIKKIRQEIELFNPDVCISFLNYVIIYTWLAIKKIKNKKNIKFIVSERNDPNNVPSTFLFRSIRNKIFSKADGCVFQTAEAKNYFKKLKSSEIIPNPVCIRRDSVFDYKRNNRDKNVLLVGSDKKEKNREMAFKAFSEFAIEFPEYKMLVVGSNPSAKDIKHIKEHGLQDKILFVGKDNNWQQKYQSAAMFVLSSDYEGMPNALLEAAALQIPCISTNCPIGGPRDILEDGKNGILINVGDYKELANKMKMLASNRRLQNHFSDQCSEILNKYSSQKISDRWMKYINSLI